MLGCVTQLGHMYRFAERLAWVAAVVLPAGETLRRWGTWWDVPFAFVDDWLIGLFFLLAAWMCHRRHPSSPRVLAASFGFGCGMGYASLASSLEALDRTDPSGVSGMTAVVVKSLMLLFGALGLVGALRGASAHARP